MKIKMVSIHKLPKSICGFKLKSSKTITRPFQKPIFKEIFPDKDNATERPFNNK